MYSNFVYFLEGYFNIFNTIDDVYAAIDEEVGLKEFYHIAEYRLNILSSNLDDEIIKDLNIIQVNEVYDKRNIVLDYDKQFVIEIATVRNNIFDITSDNFKYIGKKDDSNYKGIIKNLSDIKLPDNAIYYANGKSTSDIEETYLFSTDESLSITCFNQHASGVFDPKLSEKDNAMNAMYRFFVVDKSEEVIVSESFCLINDQTVKSEEYFVEYPYILED